MVKLKEFAKAYEPQQMKNITDLEVVDIDLEIQTEVRKDKEQKDYSVTFIVKDGIEYRTPGSVIEQVKNIIEENPEAKTFKVTKKGEGLNTRYTVIQKS